jgi:glycosyltransferase involved in cell wall biosynthesis
MAEAVRFAKAGIAVPLNDPAAMAQAILRLACSEAERKQFSTNAEHAFHAHFTLQTMVDAYFDLYQRTARARRGAHVEANP